MRLEEVVSDLGLLDHDLVINIGSLVAYVLVLLALIRLHPLHLFHFSSLFFCQFPEELYFFLTCRFPIIVGLKCTLEMGLNINIKSLWFDL